MRLALVILLMFLALTALADARFPMQFEAGDHVIVYAAYNALITNCYCGYVNNFDDGLLYLDCTRYISGNTTEVYDHPINVCVGVDSIRTVEWISLNQTN